MVGKTSGVGGHGEDGGESGNGGGSEDGGACEDNGGSGDGGGSEGSDGSHVKSEDGKKKKEEGEGLERKHNADAPAMVEEGEHGKRRECELRERRF